MLAIIKLSVIVSVLMKIVAKIKDLFLYLKD